MTHLCTKCVWVCELALLLPSQDALNLKQRQGQQALCTRVLSILGFLSHQQQGQGASMLGAVVLFVRGFYPHSRGWEG